MDVDERLRRAGLRVTAPRRAVLTALVGAGSEHLTADAVAAEVPDVHRATVYRTLEHLASVDVLAHVHLDRGITAYHVAAVPHLHAQCSHCGAVVDLPGTVLDDTVARVRAAASFVIEPGHVALMGTCADCTAHPA